MIRNMAAEIEYLITVMDPETRRMKIIQRFRPASPQGERARARLLEARRRDPGAMLWIRAVELE